MTPVPPDLYDDDSECVEDMLNARLVAFVDFIASSQFFAGVLVGCWFVVGAAFVVAF